MTGRAAGTAQPRRAMFPLAWWTAPAVFLAAFVPRLVNIGRVVYTLDDFTINVPTGLNYSAYGLLGPDNWFTQPAKHLFMRWTVLLFGNDPVGWSMRQVLFGAAIVLLVFLLGRRLFRAPFPAIMAATLAALDPLLLGFSRAASEDPLAVAFMLAAILFWLRGHEHGRQIDWLAAGALIGTASALRWYALPVAALMLALALWVARRQGVGALARIAVFLAIVPFGAYLVWYLPWIARGYSLGDWIALQADALVLQGAGAFPTFSEVFAPLAGAGGWFVRWMGIAHGVGTQTGSTVAVGAIMNDPVVWVLFMPAVAYVLWTAIRSKRVDHLLVGGSFVVLYLFFLTAQRDIFLYSAISVVPFGFLALGFTSGRVLKRRSPVLLAVLALWSLYLYPLTSAIAVPLAPYAWLLGKIGMAVSGS